MPARPARRRQPSPADAVAELAARDPVLAALAERHGTPPRRRPVPATRRYAALAEIIVYQQLAGKAAASIHGRLVDTIGGELTPERILAAPPTSLTGAGLSGSKAASIRDLAERVADGRVQLDRIGRLDDEAVVAHLVQGRGIGPWTADMFLLAVLGRLDVWPVGDYGVRVGFARGWELPEVPSPKELAVLGEPFRPYRSLVAWYCWRVLDQKLPEEVIAPTER
ncbi:MAG: DNA-3-methyladenine glycosylase 2 family protein [Acidimicrobiales bacterium]|nr:DNA-3-methyladenine glycosylase 2 family protein [Acidimicrobiales bacterium]